MAKAETITPTGQIRTTIAKTASLLSLVVLSGFLFSCDPKMVFDKWHDTPEPLWHKDSVLVFEPEITDSLQPMNIVLGVRNNNSYSFSNLWVFIDIETPSGKQKRDTFEVVLASPYGRWHGSGWGNLYTSLHYFENRVVMDQKGVYRFSIKHGMRQEQLQGIRSVGVRLEEVEN